MSANDDERLLAARSATADVKDYAAWVALRSLTDIVASLLTTEERPGGRFRSSVGERHTRAISFRLSPPLLKKLHDLAEREETSVSEIVREALASRWNLTDDPFPDSEQS